MSPAKIAPLYSFADHVSAPGMTFQPSVLPHVERGSSRTPSVELGGPEKSIDHTPAPYHASVSWRLPIRETPSYPRWIGPGEVLPLPPSRKTCAVQPRSARGSASIAGWSASYAISGFGMK